MSTLPVPTCCSLLLPLVRPLGIVVGDGSRLIAGITLTNQRANVLGNSVLTSTTLQWHRQYLGRRGFFGATSITQRVTGTATRLRTDVTRAVPTLDARNQNLTGLHLLRC